MEESEDILLLNSLAKLGVPIPHGVSSVHDLTLETFYALCSNAIGLIDPTAALPEDYTADREACTHLASTFRSLGFTEDISFDKFLYTPGEELYKLVRFLQRRLSESQRSAFGECRDENRGSMKEEADDEGVSIQNGEILTGVRNLRLRNLALESSNMKSENEVAQKFDVPNSVLQNDVDIGVQGATQHDSRETQSGAGDDGKCSSRATECLGESALSGDQDGTKEVLQNQEKKLNTQMNVKSSASLHLEEFQLPKAAEKMVFDDSQPVEFYIEQLTDLVEAKKQKFKELESEWEVMDKPLMEKQRNLKKSLLELHPETYAMLTRRKEIELETESIVADIKRREEELCKLSSEFEKQPKLPPRRTYIERINEITKNSRKQDTDIQRILKDTRELQLESNTIQERLNRTYAVVEETIFREAKKDPVARQAYTLLTNIHDSFEQIAEKILATDRCRRDFADYESKLASISSRSSNIDSIQADLDAIRRENDLLEQRLRNM